MLLAGKNAVVTGSTRGLGRAYLVGLAEAGANVVVNGRNPDQCEALAREISAGPGGNAVTFAESIASWDAGERIVDTCIEAFGSIDILVNNAGIVRDRMIFNMTEEEYDEVLATNLKGHFACARFASRHMRAQGSGRIINMTADSGLSGYTGNSNYSATKGAIATITRGWALELIKYGITVNAISPSAATEMTATIPRQHRRDKRLERHHARRARRDAHRPARGVRPDRGLPRQRRGAGDHGADLRHGRGPALALLAPGSEDPHLPRGWLDAGPRARARARR